MCHAPIGDVEVVMQELQTYTDGVEHELRACTLGQQTL